MKKILSFFLISLFVGITLSCFGKEVKELIEQKRKLEQDLERQTNLLNAEKQNMQQQLNNLNAERQNMELQINRLNAEKQNAEQQLKKFDLENTNLREQVDNLNKAITQQTVENENKTKTIVILIASVLFSFTVGFLIGRIRRIRIKNGN